MPKSDQTRFPFPAFEAELKKTKLDTSWILDSRGPKNQVDPRRPYFFLIEPELSRSGLIEEVATIFLTNKECPFRCLMCDLWKNTTDFSVLAEDLVTQIQFAISEIREIYQRDPFQIPQWKLYNSGNFFDLQAIPTPAITLIAEMANHYSIHGKLDNVIIECHPKLVGTPCTDLSAALHPRLEVAMGLETIDPSILPYLNKQMTVEDFQRSTEFLKSNDIGTRAFILLKTPFQTEEEGLEWTLKSIEWAFQNGVDCCVIIPTREGNGALDRMKSLGHFSEPQLTTLEKALMLGLKFAKENQRLFVDLWDLTRFATCPHCLNQRQNRLKKINLQQKPLPETSCNYCDDRGS